MRVTADTNIYISALNYNGPPGDFLQLAATGEIRLAVSDEILLEISETLRNKFLWPEDRIAVALETLAGITERITARIFLDVVKEDPDDNRILECAQAAHSDWIVTGDKHLLKAHQHDGIPIVSVSHFLSQFRQPKAPAPRE